MDFEKFFNPRSIAVIGASNSVGKVGHALIYNILQSKDRRVFAVNPKESEILGVLCYPSVLHIKEQIDLAVIAVPASVVPNILKECGEKKISSVIIISAGFKEVGGDGAVRERELAEIARQYDMTILGPNCLGLIDAYTDFNATFGVDTPKKGNVAFLSQSGALGTSMLDWAESENIGFSKFVSLGNEAMLTETDLLEMLKEDDNTEAVLLYLEQISDGKRFIEIVSDISVTKPMVVLNAGRSERGGDAVASHTGSLTPSSDVFEAVCHQHNVIMVNTLREFFNLAKMFSAGILKSYTNVAVVTNAGGPSVVISDLIEFSNSLSLAELSHQTRDSLKEVLPSMASTRNPVDVLGDASSFRYKEALDILAEVDDIDALLVLLTPQMMTEPEKTAEVLVEINKKKLVIPIFIGGEMVKSGFDVFIKHGMVYFDQPQDAVQALDALCHKKKMVRQENISHDDNPTFSMMSLEETRSLLKDYDIELVGGLLCSKEELISYAETQNNIPLALKVVSEDIVHKSEAHGIALNISGKEALEKAWDDIMWFSQESDPKAKIEGILAQPMIQGKEVIVGMKRDHVFGPVIIFGLGGIFVEVFKDVTMRVLPIDENVVREMIEDIKGFSILNGLRGEQPVNFDALVHIITSVARLSVEHPEIQELDLNPVIVNADDAYVVDARLMK